MNNSPACTEGIRREVEMVKERSEEYRRDYYEPSIITESIGAPLQRWGP
jgi:hypothetical protein